MEAVGALLTSTVDLHQRGALDRTLTSPFCLLALLLTFPLLPPSYYSYRINALLAGILYTIEFLLINIVLASSFPYSLLEICSTTSVPRPPFLCSARTTRLSYALFVSLCSFGFPGILKPFAESCAPLWYSYKLYKCTRVLLSQSCRMITPSLQQPS